MLETRIRGLLKTPAEPCPGDRHDWNIPGADEQSLECGACRRTTAITDEMTTETLPRPETAIGLRRAE